MKSCIKSFLGLLICLIFAPVTASAQPAHTMITVKIGSCAWTEPSPINLSGKECGDVKISGNATAEAKEGDNNDKDKDILKLSNATLTTTSDIREFPISLEAQFVAGPRTSRDPVTDVFYITEMYGYFKDSASSWISVNSLIESPPGTGYKTMTPTPLECKEPCDRFNERKGWQWPPSSELTDDRKILIQLSFTLGASQRLRLSLVKVENQARQDVLRKKKKKNTPK
jgi:hypothetical protein